MLSMISSLNTEGHIMDIQEVKHCFHHHKPILLYDPKRENEVDFVIPNTCIHESTLNFMLQYGKGLLCCAVDQDVLLKKGFFPLPSNHKDSLSTNFFIPVDHHSVNTGISTKERITTLHSLAQLKSIEDFIYPGHISILGGIGLNNRKGHTEAALELCELTDYPRIVTIIELLDHHGESHSISYAKAIANDFQLSFCSIQDVFMHSIQRKSFVKMVSRANLPTEFGNFVIVGFENQLDTREHFALVKGNVTTGEVLVRIHSECVTGDVFHSRKCDCRDQLVNSMKLLEKAQNGVLIYLRQEGRDIGITDKIKAYALQERGFDTYDANLQIGHDADERDYAVAAQMIQQLQIQSVKLITNNPSKIEGLRQYGINVCSVQNVYGSTTEFNQKYLETKVQRFHHTIPIK